MEEEEEEELSQFVEEEMRLAESECSAVQCRKAKESKHVVQCSAVHCEQSFQV